MREIPFPEMFHRIKRKSKVHNGKPPSSSRGGKRMPVIGPDHNQMARLQPHLFIIDQMSAAAALYPKYLREIMPVQGYVLS